MNAKIWWLALCAMWWLPVSIGYGQTLFYPFNLGAHEVEQTTVLFEFPDESVEFLYAFNFSAYPALSEEKNQVRLRLYDRQKKPLAEGKSICLKGGPNVRFGSIVFSSITRANVDQAVFFTLEAIACQEGRNIVSPQEDPQLRPLAKAVYAIVQILFPCMQTGRSETECLCMNRDRLKAPAKQAAAFLQSHPELEGKELAFYKSIAASDEGSESMALSIPLEEVSRFQDELDRCE